MANVLDKSAQTPSKQFLLSGSSKSVPRYLAISPGMTQKTDTIESKRNMKRKILINADITT